MDNLCLEDGSDVVMRNIGLNKATFIEVRPHETKFIELHDPKAILEQELTNYATLHKGDTINIRYAGRDYAVDILQCKPDDQVCVVEADVNLDFAAPLDYVEPKPEPRKAKT